MGLEPRLADHRSQAALILTLSIAPPRQAIVCASVLNNFPMLRVWVGLINAVEYLVVVGSRQRSVRV